MKILLTGGCGFIGSAVVRKAIGDLGYEVLNIDSLTYASNLSAVSSVENTAQYQFCNDDICNHPIVERTIFDFRPDVILHLAAETHVDRSIDGPRKFVDTNVIGTYNLLDVALKYQETLQGDALERFRFHHVSTDEVFGSLGPTGLFTETSPYKPNSPYSATKAASDHLVRAWNKTYGLKTLLSNCSNNYGPYQDTEKLIPHMISLACQNRPLPVYGNGLNVRDWLYVEDHAEALLLLLRHGKPGQNYNIGGGNEWTNIAVVTEICEILDELNPSESLTSYKNLITFVKDRPGHDSRYAIDSSKLEQGLGFTAKTKFSDGLRSTVEWYLQDFSKTASSDMTKRAGARLGLGTSK